MDSIAPNRTTVAKFVDGFRSTDRAQIFTFVRADNPVAVETYRANGFDIIGTARRHAKIDGRYIDEILIEKSLVL